MTLAGAGEEEGVPYREEFLYNEVQLNKFTHVCGGGPVKWSPMHHVEWSHGEAPLVDRMTDRQILLKILRPRNFVGGRQLFFCAINF